jgi:hypothetical protein
MKPTGKFNPFTNEEIMQCEEHDIIWRDVEFKDLEINEQADFLSFINVKYLNEDNKPYVTERYHYYSEKNLTEA